MNDEALNGLQHQVARLSTKLRMVEVIGWQMARFRSPS